MNRSQETAAISKALVAAQLEMKNPGFDTTNPHFRNKFASLAAVRNAVVPVLAKHGISVTQEIATVEGGISCLTIFTHETGQYFEFGPLVMPASKQDAQGFGSATTYAKRYSLQSAAGVVGDDDDDGNAASDKLTNVQRGDRSGRPDTSGVDKELVEAYSQGFKNALLNADSKKVLELHNELRTQAELYTATGDKLTAKQRADIRSIVDATKKVA